MDSFKTSIFILILVFLDHFQVQGQLNAVSSYFRMTRNGTVAENAQTNQYLLETIILGPFSSRLLCLFNCNKNPNCDLVVHEIDQNRCRLYKKSNSLCVSSNATQSTVLYDKFLKNLWYCSVCVAKQTQSPFYLYNTDYDLCFYFDRSNSLSWIESYEFCRNINGSLLIINSEEKHEFARNLTMPTGLRVWVGSNTTVPLVFYWLDGSPINYWNSGEPNNFTGNDTYVAEGCVAMNADGFLNDSGCEHNEKFICQI